MGINMNLTDAITQFSKEVELAERIIAACPKPDKLELLIEWLDSYDAAKNIENKEVQRDLIRLKQLLQEWYMDSPIAQGVVTVAGDSWWADNRKTKGLELNLKLTIDKIYMYGVNRKLYGQIDAHVSIDEWDETKLGLMYTDNGILLGIKNILKDAGFIHYDKISWSEQGMQKRQTGNLDIYDELCEEFLEKGLYTISEIGVSHES
jgi:hypothetical protein